MKITLISFVLLLSMQGFSQYKSVKAEVMFDGEYSIRALKYTEGKIWFGSNHGIIGYFDPDANFKFEKQIDFNGQQPDFRSIDATSEHVFALNAGSPALLYRIKKDGTGIKSVYRDLHKDIFYDAIKFRNNMEGMAFGDPIDGCFSILTTANGGQTWTKLPYSDEINALDGEAGFAASNSILILKGQSTWLFTGGMHSRMFFSDDKGKSWRSEKLPIIQGNKMTGVFCADFYDDKIGIVSGGDYEKPLDSEKNKAITVDGGKTWVLIAAKGGFGYASAIKFVPNSGGNQIVSVGATGLWYSSDRGNTWEKLLDDVNLYSLEFADEKTAYAGGKGKLVKLTFK